MGDNLRLTVLGARGSVPVSGKEYDIFGGSTSCYMVEAGEYVIFLDAGTGIVNAPPIDNDKKIMIVLSHPHLDHIIGLPFFSELSKKGRHIVFYESDVGGQDVSLQIEKAFSPPYWPLPLLEYPSDLNYKKLELPLVIDDALEISGITLRHPGGSIGLKITYKGKSIVYLTDYEMEDAPDKEVAEFSKNADLLLCDAQYLEDEYQSKKGFGHSTVSKAELLGKMTEAKQVLLIHHDPGRQDEEILKLEAEIGSPNIRFARQGESITV